MDFGTLFLQVGAVLQPTFAVADKVISILWKIILKIDIIIRNLYKIRTGNDD